MPAKTEQPHLLIRADAGGYLGTGHVMRMIALAQAWLDRGGSATIAACQCPDSLIGRLEEEAIGFVQLGDHEPGSNEDATETIALAGRTRSKWIVLDGYHFGSSYQKSLKEAGVKLLAVDDYGHCETWHSDLILNQNVYGADFPYPSKGDFTKVLGGGLYALLRREFTAHVDLPDTKPLTQIHNLLFTFGGVDPDNATGKVISALNSIDAPRLNIRALVGAGSPHGTILEELVSRSPHDIKLLRNISDMPSQYLWADGVIGAGGTTCLEWILFGLPAALVRVADNQNLVVDTLAAKGRCLDLGWHLDLEPAQLASQLSTWIQTAVENTNFESFRVDRQGASRVTAMLSSGLRLRPAIREDCELYFQWANDPDVRANSLNTETINWESHCNWYGSRFESPFVHFFVCVNADDNPVGQVRFEKR